MGQTSDRDVEAEEDPLVELARIVSEDGGFSGPKAVKPKVARVEPPARDSLADGLEAELLQELETSFAVREPPVRAPVTRQSPPAVAVRAAAPSRAPASVPVAEEEPDPDELLRSIEEQLSQFERRQANRFASASESFSVDAGEAESPVNSFAVEAPKVAAADVVPEPPEAWQGRRTSRIRPFAESNEATDEAEVAAPEPVFEEPPVRPAARSEYRFRGPASAEWDRAETERDEAPPEPSRDDPQPPEPEPVLFQAERPEPAPVAQAAPPSAAKSNSRGQEQSSSDELRRERLAAVFPEFDEQPAPPPERPAPDLTALEAGLSRELEPSYADASADKWQDGDAPVDEPRGAAAIAPGPSRRAAAARAAQQRGRSRFGMLTAAAVVLVIVIGGGGAYYLRSSEGTPSGPPPVIAADEGAVRVDAQPGQAPAEGETVGEAVYNRVAGTPPATDEQVVENAEEPREIARIVLPPSQSDADESLVRPVGSDNDAATTEAVPPAPAAASGEDEIGPRRVPTFVVKADGTIVSTSEAGAASDPTAGQAQQLTTETEPIEPVPVPTVSIADSGAPAGDASAQPPVPTPPVESATAADDMVPRPTIDEPPAEVAAIEPAETPPAEAAPADAGAAPDLAALAPATPAPTASAGGGYLVQLSSEGSMADAQSAYARAKARFPTVLGNLDPQIQEADLGAKGIFFRVRVGPWETRKDAVDVCEALKAAGGKCFVAQ